MSDDDTCEEIYRKFFTTDDMIKLEWKILKYMCDMSGIYDTFPETLLFHRNDFKTFIDRKLEQGYSDDKVGKLYKLIMDKVMTRLEQRNAVEVVAQYRYGDSKMILYEKKKILKYLCNEFKKYTEADKSFIDRLLPVSTQY